MAQQGNFPERQMPDNQQQRAYGALMGLAIGDALGMPSQTLSRQEIALRYGLIKDFIPPFPDHPVSHGLQAAQVTDDTEQMLLLAARLISDNGDIDQRRFGQDLLDWEADILARDLRDILGPSTKAALMAMLAGTSIRETGLNGTTNGAAMRIAPVGLSTPVEPIDQFVNQVEKACQLTHNTGIAIAAASAVASVISCGIDGKNFEASLETALHAARAGQQRGRQGHEQDIATLIEAALTIARSPNDAECLATQVGNSVAACQSVPCAFGVVSMARGDPWRAGLIAANIGDDTDTIGAIACAMAGACKGISAIPRHAIDAIQSANALPLENTANALLSLRKTYSNRLPVSLS